MKNYPEIKFGRYKGRTVDDVPMNYLVWLFPKLQFKKSSQPLFKEILRFFLSKNIRVEDHRNKSQGFHFYFNDYTNVRVGGGEKPFMQSFKRMKNSKGEFVYEVGSDKYPIFLDVEDETFVIATNYKAMTYKFGGLKMVYERNPDYYFYDGYGRILRGAYLMRKPWIPDGAYLSGDFSENLPIENLENKNYKTF